LHGILKRFYQPDGQNTSEEIRQYFHSNKQCKLPWRI
jgi:hypothetical protein